MAKEKSFYQTQAAMRTDMENILIKFGDMERQKLVYLLLKNYAVSQLAIEKHIDLLLENKKIEETKGGILIWRKPEGDQDGSNT